jgi:hypothetical protein
MPRFAKGDVLSNWHTLFDDFSTSSQDFYRAVEIAIVQRSLPGVTLSRVLFSEGGIGAPNREYLRVRRKRIVFDICSAPYANGHFFSWWLAKIPARFGLLYVIALVAVLLPVWAILCTLLTTALRGSCFGGLLSAGLFWSGIPAILLLLGFLVDRGKIGDVDWVLSVPILAQLYILVFNPITYYRIDTAMMFRDAVREIVNEVINSLLEEKGLRVLGDAQLEPDQDEKAS